MHHTGQKLICNNTKEQCFDYFVECWMSHISYFLGIYGMPNVIFPDHVIWASFSFQFSDITVHDFMQASKSHLKY